MIIIDSYCCSNCLDFKRKKRFKIDRNGNVSDFCDFCVEKYPDKIKMLRLAKNGNFNIKIDGRKTKPKKSYAENYLVRRAYIKKRLANDASFRISNNLRSRILAALKNKNKSASTIELLGCDIVFFKKHLSGMFKTGMTWDNYGEWEIDHIKPCSKFNLIHPDQQKECFNYKNTQPLWKFENRSKGNRYLDKI